MVMEAVKQRQYARPVSPRQAAELPPEQWRAAAAAIEDYRGSRELALGEFRRAIKKLRKAGAPQAALARAMGISRQRLWDMLNEK